MKIDFEEDGYRNEDGDFIGDEFPGQVRIFFTLEEAAALLQVLKRAVSEREFVYELESELNHGLVYRELARHTKSA